MLRKIIILLFISPITVYAQNQQPSTIVNNIFTGNGSWERNNVGIDTFNPVGIGSTNPGVSLDVQGTIRDISEVVGSSGLILSNVASGTQCLQANSSGLVSGTGSACGSGGGGSQTPWTSAINGAGYSLYGTGNVGVNSTTPGQALDVQGTVRTQGFTLTGNGAASGYVLTSNGSLGIGTWAPAGGGGGGANPGGSATQLQYQVNGTTFGGITGSSVVNGNIGLGSASPGQILDVTGTVRAIALTTIGGTSSQFVKGNGSLDSTSYGTGTVTNVTGTSPLTSSGGTTPAISINSSTGSGAVVLQTSPNLIANVGIGSTSPGQTLDVQGTVRDIGETITPLTSVVVVANSSHQLVAATNLTDTAYSTATGANPSATIGLSANNGSSANFMRADASPTLGVTISPTWTGNHIFAPSSGNTVFTVGNVGIGSTNPGAMLDVQGTIRSLGINLPNATNNYVLTSDANGNGTWKSASAGSSQWTGTNPIYFPSSGSGNVGISSAVPGAMLDVQGTIRAIGIFNKLLNFSESVSIGGQGGGQ